MSRPTQEQVDAAIEHYHEESQCAIERGCAAVLADEVRALRNELEYERNLRAALERQIGELSMQLVASEKVLP